MWKNALRIDIQLKHIIAGVCALLLSACTALPPQETPTAAERSAPAVSPMPTVTPTAALPTPARCDRGQGGEVERVTLHSELQGLEYAVSVYTPPCYGEEEGVTYPVLYLLHGQNMDDTFWLSLGAAEIADELIAAGGRPFLMVMPQEVKNFDPVEESHFDASILNELIPWVEGHYRVCAERACRAIGGISRGGGWAMRLAARNFDTFGAVGAHSMGLMQGDAWQIQKHLETRSLEEYPRIYLDRGEDDFLYEGIDYFEEILREKHIPHEFHINPGKHDQAYWQAHVGEYLRWYAAGWEGRSSTVDK